MNDSKSLTEEDLKQAERELSRMENIAEREMDRVPKWIPAARLAVRRLRHDE